MDKQKSLLLFNYRKTYCTISLGMYPFFKDIDMKKLLAKEIEAPYIPKVGPVNTNQKVTESILPEEKIKAIEEKKD